MDECVYFTNRTLENGGRVKAWVYKVDCPSCGKALMGKPVEGGKVKIRAKEYACPACGHTEDKQEHESGLTVEIMYKCPYCGHEGEATTEYRRKSFNGVPGYVFACGSCKKKIGITKKMK
jgi:predicted RNA-binding Zn-ribbon protein involved in translation (DUF1610 family)